MSLINYTYIDLFFNKQIHDDYEKEEYEMFTEYLNQCLGLVTIYSKIPKIEIAGFKVLDQKKWLLAKIKYGI